MLELVVLPRANAPTEARSFALLLRTASLATSPSMSLFAGPCGQFYQNGLEGASEGFSVRQWHSGERFAAKVRQFAPILSPVLRWPCGTFWPALGASLL